MQRPGGGTGAGCGMLGAEPESPRGPGARSWDLQPAQVPWEGDVLLAGSAYLSGLLGPGGCAMWLPVWKAVIFHLFPGGPGNL